MTLKAVIFDIDGTLIDSVDLHAEAWREALLHFGHDIPYEEVRWQIGKGGDQLMAALLTKGDHERQGEEIERYRSQLFKERYLPKAVAFPHVRDLFKKLKASGLRVALASSCKADEMPIYERVANIKDLVDSKTCGDDVDRSKPESDIFEVMLRRLGDLQPEQAIAVGDAPYDAEAAGKAGLRTIGVLSGGFPEEALRKAGVHGDLSRSCRHAQKLRRIAAKQNRPGISWIVCRSSAVLRASGRRSSGRGAGAQHDAGPHEVPLIGLRISVRPTGPFDLLVDRLENRLHETSRNLHRLRVAFPHELDALLDEAILHFHSAL
jgi:HAD superfamily hydrolase (TIGR01509 family)